MTATLPISRAHPPAVTELKGSAETLGVPPLFTLGTAISDSANLLYNWRTPQRTVHPCAWARNDIWGTSAAMRWDSRHQMISLASFFSEGPVGKHCPPATLEKHCSLPAFEKHPSLPAFEVSAKRLSHSERKSDGSDPVQPFSCPHPFALDGDGRTNVSRSEPFG